MRVSYLNAVFIFLFLGGCQTGISNGQAVNSSQQNGTKQAKSNINNLTKLMPNITPSPEVVGNYINLKTKYLSELQSANAQERLKAKQVLDSFGMCERIYSREKQVASCLSRFIPIYEDNDLRLSSLASYGVGGITCDGRWSAYANRDRDGDGIECEWGENSVRTKKYTPRSSGSTYVRGYRRKDGTYVKAHRRKKRR